VVYLLPSGRLAARSDSENGGWKGVRVRKFSELERRCPRLSLLCTDGCWVGEMEIGEMWELLVSGRPRGIRERGFSLVSRVREDK